MKPNPSREPRPIAIDPLADCVFKSLFATEANKDILHAFLNAVLDAIALPRAVSVELVAPRHLRQTEESKEIEVDVRAVDEEGRTFQIEVQLSVGGSLAQRMVYGAGQLYNAGLRKGADYDTLKPTIAIWILRGRLPGKARRKAPLTCYRFRDSVGLELHPFPSIVVIELKNWQENAIFTMDIERWFIFFKHGKEFTLGKPLPEPLQSEVFMKALKEAQDFKTDLFKRIAYDAYMDKVIWKRTLENRARKKAERMRQKEERVRQEEERVRQEKEQVRLENERLRADRQMLESEARELAAKAAALEAMELRLVEDRRRLAAGTLDITDPEADILP